MSAQDNYDQLKRRNRRRLVGALVMVVTAAILLAIMMSRRTPQSIPVPKLEVKTTTPTQHPNTNSVSAPTASNIAAINERNMPASGVVLEPEPNHDTANIDTTDTTVTVPEQTAPQRIVHSTTNTSTLPMREITKQQQTTHNDGSMEHVKTETSTPSENTRTSKNVKTQVNKKPSPVGETDSAKQEIDEKPKKSSNTTDKTVANRPVDSKSHTTVPTKTTTEKIKKPSHVDTTPPQKKTSSLNRLTPEQILENKAATSLNRPTATHNSKANVSANKNQSNAKNSGNPIERTIIQVGAYTTEAQAKIVQQKLALAGIATNISSSQTSKGMLFRVRSNVYNSRAQALQNLDKMRAAGLDGLVIGL